MNCEAQTNFFRKGVQKPAKIDPKAVPRVSKIDPGTLPGCPGSPKELPGTCWSVPGTPRGRPDSAPRVPGTSLSARTIAPKRPETLRSDQNCNRVASKCRKIDVFRAGRSRRAPGTCFLWISSIVTKCASPPKYRTCRSKQVFGLAHYGSS